MPRTHKERWRPVVGYETRYWVSDLGRVRSQRCVLSPAPQSKGYLCVSLYDGSSPKRPKTFCVHDLVAVAFVGPKPIGKQVNHKDTQKTNNRATNLEYVTPLKNMQHARRHGLIPAPCRGTEHANAVLTVAQVRSIRTAATIRTIQGRRVRSLSNAALGRQHGCSDKTIAGVIARETYKEVQDEPAPRTE